MEIGSLEYAALGGTAYTSMMFFSGIELVRVEKEMAKYTQAIQRLNQKTMLNHYQMLHQSVLNLLGKSNDPCVLTGSAYNVSKMAPVHKKANDKTALFFLSSHLLNLNYIFENYNEALKNLDELYVNIEVGVSLPYIPLFYFYDSMTRLVLYPSEKNQHEKKF